MANQSSINLFPGERIVIEDNDGMLTLTNYRVRLDQRGTGRSRLVSITLDSVASCGLVTKGTKAHDLAARTVAGTLRRTFHKRTVC